MSPSPLDASDPSAVGQYANAWRAILELVRQGSSWSGRERHCVMLNCGPTSGSEITPFADISAVSGLDFADDGRAVAVVDWDQDGDLDLWFRNRTAPRLRLMLNQTTTKKKQAKDFAAFRLQAVKGNRDAIGARVEIRLKRQPMVVQTLTAGDGFLSQSSKWLHFGLGDDARIERVTVRWPSGETERFSGVRPGGRYHLEQGTARAVAWNRRQVATGLAAMAQTPPPESALAAIALPAKIPLPEIDYFDSQGLTKKVATNGRPKLLVFWASWCASCAEELKTLGQHADQLAAKQLEVLALAVDQASSSSGDPLAAATLIQRLEFPFDHGSVNERSIEKIQHFQRSLFENTGQFSVPLSILIDRRGRVAAIYRGPVPIDTLWQDVDTLDADSKQRRDLALPYGGRWYTQAITPSAATEMVGNRFIEKFPLDAARYLSIAAQEAVNDPRRSRLAVRSSALYLQQARTLANEGSAAQARRCFLAAVGVAPKSVTAHRDFGVFLTHEQEFGLAEKHLLRAQDMAPNDNQVQQALTRLRQLQGGP